MEHFVCTSDGGRIHYEFRQADSSAPVVLLLRRLGGSLADWGRFRELLARRRSVLAFDFRGAGRSSPLRFGARVRHLARDTLELLDELGLERVDAFGSSFGGMVALRLALDAAPRVRRLVLASTPARGIDVVQGVLRNRLELVTCLAKSRGAAEACLAQRVLSRQASPELRRALAEQAQRVRAPRRELLKALMAAAAHDVRSELHRITQPTLVLAGADDPLLSPVQACEVATVIPRARLSIIPRVGHDLTSEAPDETAERVLAFFDEARPAEASSALH